MTGKLCTNCGYAPRWRGAHGTNDKLTMCEQCQRAYWREKKAASNRQRPPETERTCTVCGQTFPLDAEHFYRRSERGRLRHECKACYSAMQSRSQARRKRRQQPPTPAAPVQPVVHIVKTDCETVKVLVVDRTHNRLYRLEVPISNRLNKPLGETRYADQLIAFYRHSGHIVVEV